MNKNIKFFLGANSDKGFVSYFEQLQDYKESLQLFVLKGGPGSGKSSLMKKIRNSSVLRNNHVENIHCASDPSSLDGFIDHTMGFAMIDGTAPHVVDPHLPGARAHIINTGEFWDSDILSKSAEEINRLTMEISDYHKSATAYIKAAAELIKENTRLSKERIKEKEARQFSKMITEAIANNDSPRECVRLLSAVTVGKVEFFSDTLSEYVEKVYVIDDPWGYSSDLILKEIRRAAHLKGTQAIVCPCSVIPERIEHIILPSEGIAISTRNYFHDSQKLYAAAGGFYNSLYCESEMKKRQLASQKMISLAAKSVEKAKLLHDDLEKYYTEAMDFSKIDTALDKIERKIFNK